MKRYLLLTLAAGALGTPQTPAAENPIVLMDTSMGKIKIELYPDKAPITVKNFLKYVDEKYYDGTIFHRVIPNFMIQGGGMEPGLKEKGTHAPIKNEASNGLLNKDGTLAMARTNDPNSATDQFFINVNDNRALNFRSPDPGGIGYTVFGKVVSGMDVVNKIAKAPKGGGKPVPPGTPVDPKDVPSEPIVITSARIVEAGK